MGTAFNADEVLEMALEIERNGANFYRRAAELQQHAHSKAMLLELAAMEDDHYKSFSEMRASLTEEERKETTYDPHGELPLYLRAMADKHVFDTQADPSQKLTGKESMADVLRFAIGMEKDSIVFYLGLQDVVPPRLGGGRIKEILKEEMGHIATLGELLRCARE
jgi:rubrerythrin